MGREFSRRRRGDASATSRRDAVALLAQAARQLQHRPVPADQPVRGRQRQVDERLVIGSGAMQRGTRWLGRFMARSSSQYRSHWAPMAARSGCERVEMTRRQHMGQFVPDRRVAIQRTRLPRLSPRRPPAARVCRSTQPIRATTLVSSKTERRHLSACGSWPWRHCRRLKRARLAGLAPSGIQSRAFRQTLAALFVWGGSAKLCHMGLGFAGNQ